MRPQYTLIALLAAGLAPALAARERITSGDAASTVKTCGRTPAIPLRRAVPSTSRRSEPVKNW
jgi:hypothetical protein